MNFGYARISTDCGQDTAAQIDALRAAGCERMFEERASGGCWDQPELHRMLDQLRDGDVVIVWKLDRLSRSLKDLLAIMAKIDAAGAGFRSVTESIDTTTPAGRMMMQMVGVFAPGHHLNQRLSEPPALFRRREVSLSCCHWSMNN
ncbi:resolvase-like protein [Yoonia maricola]|uniref:Resolvase-like protein n=1 Tax=Yoonia maricola TaxID=420999 RepID=A0A2M8W1W5_9RHOB|nr:recombinase family protein [Yoonia maricola]PJI84915.1 resolvase-like protein [Yoonia maricola]